MREGAKTRLTGAVVLVTLAVIFVPMLFEEPPGPPPADPAALPLPPSAAHGGPPPRPDASPKPPPWVPGNLAAPAPVPDEDDTDPDVPGTAPVQPAPPPPAAAPASPTLVKPPSGGPPAWVVQVASLGNIQSAAELEGRLRDGGFAAFVEQADVNGRTYYRVRVGPERERARAEQLAARLRSRYQVETLIHRYP